MSCPDCGAPLDDVPVGEPCPKCDGVRRNARFEGSAAVSVGVAISGSVRVGNLKQKPWQRKWLEVEHQLAALEDYYANRSPLSNIVAELIAENYFKTCRELADALIQNPTVPVSKTQIMRFVHSNPDLRLCDAIAQTVKHNLRKPTPDNPDPISAWIEWFDTTAGIQIAWENPSATVVGGDDALVLARRCKAAWDAFLGKHGLI
jgi:hypothetical protein